MNISKSSSITMSEKNTSAISKSIVSKSAMQTIDLISLIGTSDLGTQSALAKAMRQVCEADTPLTIDGAGKDQVVMMPLETFNKLTGIEQLLNEKKNLTN